MWLLRIANRGRWSEKSAEDSNHVDQAAKDVSLRKNEQGLSVFEVEDSAEADWVATLIALTTRPGRPERIDYLLIPPDCFAALGLVILPVPDPALIASCPTGTARLWAWIRPSSASPWRRRSSKMTVARSSGSLKDSSRIG